MIGFSLTTAPIQTYFGVEGLVRSADVHAGPAAAPFTGVPHETVILIWFSLVGNPVPIVTVNVPTVVGRDRSRWPADARQVGGLIVLDECAKVTHRLSDLHIAECGDRHVSYR